MCYAVRFGVLAHFLGQLAAVLGGMTLVPGTVALIVGESRFAVRYGIVAAALLGGGLILSRVRVRGRLQTNESLAIAALTFLLAPVVMTYPLTAGGLGVVDGLFQAVSAVTTTGLSTIGPAESQSRTLLFARAWMQWYGGLGIVVLSVALVMRTGLTAKQLSDQPLDEEDLVGSARARARTALLVYGGFTALGIVAMLAAGAGLFEGSVHTFTAVSTGGFSTSDRSLAGFASWAPPVVVLGLCLVGATSLTLWRGAVAGRWRPLLLDPQTRALAAFVGLIAATLTATFHFLTDMPWPAAIHHGLTTATSAQTTAGFSSIPIDSLDPASKLVIMLSMLVGGGLGSTAGGVKLLRMLVFFRLVQAALRRTCMPRHGVYELRLGGQRLADSQVRDALLIVVLYVGVIAASWLAFAVGGYQTLDALFDIVSAVGTVGLSTGVTSPDLPSTLKLVLCADMLMGRVEIVALLVLIYPRTWFGKRVELL